MAHYELGKILLFKVKYTRIDQKALSTISFNRDNFGNIYMYIVC